MKSNEKTVFMNAIKRYGIPDQIQVACEECAELIQALSKYQRVSKHQAHDKRKIQRCLNNITEELADVSIMLDQIKLMHGITEKAVSEVRAAKVERLESHLNEEE